MKIYFSFIFTFLFCQTSFGQNLTLQIDGSNLLEKKIIDSLQYSSKHNNIKSIQDEIAKTTNKLLEIGFIAVSTVDALQKKDSIFKTTLQLGPQIKTIYITVRKNSFLKQLPELTKKDTVTLPYAEAIPFLNRSSQALEQRGFALVRLSLINITTVNTSIFAELHAAADQKRTLNAIVVKYSPDGKNNPFPKGHSSQINKKYKNKIFNKGILNEIYQDFENFQFVTQTKYPEILFTADSTKVYVYLEKRKANTFDGFIGFANTENNKLALNGYADIKLTNILGTGEQVALYWKSDGNNQKSFNATVELPYIAQTPIGLKAQLQLFRQDSTFQNTKTAIDLSYLINYNTRLYMGYNTTISNDIQNSAITSIGDFTNRFITSTFTYSKITTRDYILPTKTFFSCTAGVGARKVINEDTNSNSRQFFIAMQAAYLITLNKKNNIHLASQNYYLQSDQYLINEQYRFGGFNSIRGFAENSLQAYFTSSILTEYRYNLAPNLYLHTILDYCRYANQQENQQLKKTTNIFGVGFGLGLQTKNGLLKFALATGSTSKQQIQFVNTIAHICYYVKF